jgi:two-component system, NtrC family, response regulator
MKGAFTDAYSNRVGRFEMAQGGTIFLDEIGDLDLSSQVKLLRVLQDKTYQVLGDSKTKKANIRVVAATNKDLTQMIQSGTFREDLFYRINLVTIHLPSLMQRKTDIPLLVAHFMDQLRKDYNRKTEISSQAVSWLSNQPFSGNIRELKNLLERTFLLSRNKTLQPDEFSKTEVHSLPTKKFNPGDMTIDEMEVLMIKNALKTHQNNVSKVAEALGLSRGALYRRFEKYEIDVKPDDQI